MIQIVETAQKTSGDPKVLFLIKEMMGGRIEEIRPVVDITKKGGVVYPQLDQILDITSGDVSAVLDSLVEEKVLESHFYDRLIFCPMCNSMNLRPSLRCPKCSSGNVAKGRIIEHFACGKNGLEEEFITGGRYICPQCQKPLKYLGTDYRSLGVNYKCRGCGLLFAEISLKWQCMQCGVFFPDEEAKVQIVNSYVLNDQNRNRLTFDMDYKSKFEDYLKRKGYEIFEQAKISGGSGSGATHVLDIVARRDDGFLVFIIGVGIAIGSEGEAIGLEDVFRFDNKAYDLGIHDKVLLAMPGLNSEARQFARRQRIRTYDAKDLAEFLGGVEAKLQPDVAKRQVTKVPFKFESRSQLVKYLSGQGYRVEEKARIRGRSGAEYTIDVIAYFDDGLFTHTIAIGILTDPNEVGIEPVSSFDTKSYDICIHDKILLIFPALSKEARQFAEQQRIKIIDVADPGSLL